MPHPHSFLDNDAGFTDRNGQSVREGDKVRYEIDGRTAIMDEAFQDGEAFVTWDDGKHDTVKWRNLTKITSV